MSQQVKQKWFGVLRKCRIRLAAAWQFTNVVPWPIQFSESPNKYAYEFLICIYEYTTGGCK